MSITKSIIFSRFVQLPTTDIQNATPLHEHMPADISSTSPLVDSRVDVTMLQTMSDFDQSLFLLFSSMRGRQQLSCPVLRPPNGPNARPQDNIHLA